MTVVHPYAPGLIQIIFTTPRHDPQAVADRRFSEAVHPVTIVQALIVLAVQLAVGNLGREDARSLLNETLSDGLAGAAKIGIDEPTH